MASQIVSLSSLTRKSADEMKASLASGGCSTSSDNGETSCGSAEGQDDLPEHIWNKVKDHPCYSEEAHHYFARMHVAVAPACNIQCNYCNRKYDCSNESRPGVVSEKLTPEQAARKVVAVASEVPQLSVLGVAGPGDSLASPQKTFRTFELVAEQLPHIKACVSTNGLALPDYVDDLMKINIDHVTITINMVDPDIGAEIYPWIFYKHKRWYGRDAAEILMERQMKGLEMLTERGILVKVNSVMIPGINDEHLKVVNAEVKKRGAFLHNIMPLISEAEHGTHFGLTGQRGPEPSELKDLQDALSGGAKLMKHCRQCRADAVGLLGEDRGAEFTLDKIPEVPVYDPSKREAYVAVVEQERADRRDAAKVAEANVADLAEEAAILVAVATKGGGRINEHFGHAKEFQVYEVDSKGARFIGHRKTETYCEGGFGEDATLDGVIKALAGVKAVLCSKIGHCPKDMLIEAGIDATDEYALDYIETAAMAYFAKQSDKAETHALTA